MALGLAAVLFLLAASGLSAMPRGERHELRHEIDQLEDRWRDAMLTANEADLNALLSDDYMGITANGTLQTKEEMVANVRSGGVRFKSIEVSDRKVRFYGSTALVTSRVEITGSGTSGNFSGSYRYTHVYARSAAGSWQIVSFEASRIREGRDNDDRR